MNKNAQVFLAILAIVYFIWTGLGGGSVGGPDNKYA